MEAAHETPDPRLSPDHTGTALRPSVDQSAAAFQLQSGADLLRWALAVGTDLGVSDIQFRSNRLLYVETSQGMRILAEPGILSEQMVLDVLKELIRFKEETNRNFEGFEANREDSDVLYCLHKTRVADFACQQIDMDGRGRLSGRLRIQAHFSASGLGVTCRILNETIPELEELGLSVDLMDAMRAAVQRRAGLALVTGPTGSGKSTTLASLIDWLRRNHCKHIVTVEDPVEYSYPPTMDDPTGTGYQIASPGLVTQQEVGRDVSSYHQGLKDVLRKAPHVILLGEIRDRQAMETALEAAQTGHFVISTLHTTGAVKTMGRILEMFPREKHEAILGRMSEMLVFILSQGLLRTENGRVLTYEFLQNGDDACASAIANYYGGSRALEDVIRRSGNVEWDAQLYNLYSQGLIDAETFENNRMKRGEDSSEF